MLTLDDKSKRQLRALAHSLKPVVIVGNAGLTEAVLREIDLSLEHHELIKVRIKGSDQAQRKPMAEKICLDSRAILVQCIGHIAVIYRPAKQPRIKLRNR